MSHEDAVARRDADPTRISYARGFAQGYAGKDADVLTVLADERDDYMLGWAEGIYAAQRERDEGRRR